MALARTEILTASGVVKSYRTDAEVVHALAGIDLVVRAGEFLAVTGPSGSGKTTLLNCLSGLDDIDEGSIVIEGVDLASADDATRTEQRASSMGFVFQAANLLPVFTAVENVALPLVLAGVSRKQARQTAGSELGRVGLGDRLAHFPAQLSGGEQQRVAIARAFAKGPRIVWADEPTANLDTKTAAGVETVFNKTRVAISRASDGEQVPSVSSSLSEDVRLEAANANVGG